MNSLE